MTSAANSLRWTHLKADTVPQWSELTNLLADVDGTGEFYETEDLAEELDEHGFTPETDSWAVWEEDRLIAYGQLRVGLNPDHDGVVRCQLTGGVHPDWRGRGIGRELMDRMEARARDLAHARQPGVPARFRASGELEGSSVRRLLSHRGYAVVRYFNDLARPLPGDPPPVPDTGEVTLISPTEEHKDRVRVAHNAAFRDHWGSSELSPERWHDFWAARSTKHELSSVALSPAGEVLAYVLAGQWVPRQLYVTIVGTTPAARGNGLAAACLARTLRLGGETGEFDSVELEVDSDSPTGATRLYERLGFAMTKTRAAMQRDA